MYVGAVEMRTIAGIVKSSFKVRIIARLAGKSLIDARMEHVLHVVGTHLCAVEVLHVDFAIDQFCLILGEGISAAIELGVEVGAVQEGGR
jgi:hypothetical protein